MSRVKNSPRNSEGNFMRMVQRNVEVKHTDAGRGIQIAITGLFGSRREYPNVSPASVDRFRRFKARHLVALGDADEYAWGIVVRYRYMPDCDIAVIAEHINEGASNPVAILYNLWMVAHYVARKQGHSGVFTDAAYILMMNQLMFISGFGEVPFEKYRTANAVIADGEYSPLATT